MNWTDALVQLRAGNSITSATNSLCSGNCYIKHFDFTDKQGNVMKRPYQVNPDTTEVNTILYNDVKNTTDWSVVS